MRYKAPRGTQDILPSKVERWQRLETAARRVMERYGYREIRTPDFEEEDLFLRTVGEETDIVAKEMYSFTDRKGRRLALRPEGTAPVIRSYIENAMWKERRLQKLYYLGPMFRYDRPQKGRYRQFHQIGAEAVGSLSPLVDAEVIAMMVAVLREAGIRRLVLKLNSLGDTTSRASYIKALVKYFRGHEERLCGDCRLRLKKNPMRILDCKVPSCNELAAGIPAMEEYLSQEAREHYDQVQHWLRVLGVSFEKDKNLVRGLDYYTRTAFEVHHGELGATVALGGGGRYDGLVAECGGPDTPGIGFSLGTERVLLAIEQDKALRIKFEEDKYVRKAGYYIAWLGDIALKEAFSLAGFIRKKVRVEMEFEEGSLKSRLRQADRLRLSHAIILGENELKEEKFLVRELSTGNQEKMELSHSEEMRNEMVKKLIPYYDAEKKYDKAMDDLSYRTISGALSEYDGS
ncbi:MAG: histidine--tRNA ligase [Candidatus Glassbacteria bacterium]|nr:histidine--tRNA ligase [Candidatus Glassbacteria bacterium]